MNPRTISIAVFAALMGVGVFLLTHVGSYPWISQTAEFSALGIFVAINTVIFALLALTKMSYRAGLRAARAAEMRS